MSSIEEAAGAPPEHALYALEASSGELLLRLSIPGRAISSPVVSNGRVYTTAGNSAVDELGVDLAGAVRCFRVREP